MWYFIGGSKYHFRMQGAGMQPSEVLTLLLEEKVEFLLLQFTDILGSIKTVEIPASKFDAALAGEVMFDGSGGLPPHDRIRVAAQTRSGDVADLPARDGRGVTHGPADLRCSRPGPFSL